MTQPFQGWRATGTSTQGSLASSATLGWYKPSRWDVLADGHPGGQPPGAPGFDRTV